MDMLTKMQIVYQAMEKEADEEGYYEGFLTQLVGSLGISTPYYTSVMRDLQRLGCVTQVRRGGGAAKSKWQIVRPPTQELVDELEYLPSASTQRGRQQLEVSVRQQLRDMNNRIDQLTNRVNYLEAIVKVTDSNE